MLLSNKLSLKDYPERIQEDFVLYEPSHLPFGGRYVGLTEYHTFVIAKLSEFYDLNRFEFTGVHGDGNVVFATLKIGLRNSDKSLLLCERFTFEEDKIAEIRVFISD